MSNFAWILIVVLLLTLLGTLTLILITVKFYWGDRGKPPLIGAERRQQKELEMRLRAKQIENAKRNPIPTRKSSFWNNEKVYQNKNSEK